MRRLELAKILGIHPRTLDKFVEEGMPVAVRGRGGRASDYDEVKVRAWLKVRNAVSSEGSPSEDLRAERERWKAALLEQRFRDREQNLIPVEQRDAAWTAECQRITKTLNEWRRQTAPRLLHVATTGGVIGVEQLLSDAVHDVLRTLAGSSEEP